MISTKELLAHIEEDDKNFRQVIELMKEALADDEKLKARLQRSKFDVMRSERLMGEVV